MADGWPRPGRFSPMRRSRSSTFRPGSIRAPIRCRTFRRRSGRGCRRPTMSPRWKPPRQQPMARARCRSSPGRALRQALRGPSGPAAVRHSRRHGRLGPADGGFGVRDVAIALDGADRVRYSLTRIGPEWAKREHGTGMSCKGFSASRGCPRNCGYRAVSPSSHWRFAGKREKGRLRCEPGDLPIRGTTPIRRRVER